ncbi:sn-glycerol-3-phosphate ABC transporter ATP-binding protein UgpC [Asticcacaulis sp. 201]|uniref:ABC transporter ATP-binding protein n=1 Tax=Asticcacaulis sp. 201 TaxID=3028787 RepID=UPI002916FE49|nr:sn-glycerol-3-phosphate ABC transporter ATP-binding protein UgpC [Asticcacaulis sp. 201]MDV6331950.1 sn-glycerol-3-phosphate ABC transporter ATP-binding protein UgpC [Asticcacaulis sp. 201]
MSGIAIKNVSKAYGPVSVLEDISLTVEPNECVAFLGPSGCGKSTLLRMIAGLEDVDAGEIHIGDRRVDTLAPGARGVAMVFQHYALYPHMTVADNMAFGLKNIGVDKVEIVRRIDEAARILELSDYLDRKPEELSGGQKQRVAIGRAIVKNPDLFLFDEPLSNLDAALRMRTRLELAQLRRRLKATMILVTHDQVEAMTLADRIVVVNDRRIQQVGTPMDVYARPANIFVAGFVGSPPMNILKTEIGESGGFVVARLGGRAVATRVGASGLPQSTHWRVGLRPETVAVVAPGAGDLDAQVEFVERLGERTLVYTKLADGTPMTAEDAGISKVRMGDTVGLNIDAGTAHIFDGNGTAYHTDATE